MGESLCNLLTREWSEHPDLQESDLLAFVSQLIYSFLCCSGSRTDHNDGVVSVVKSVLLKESVVTACHLLEFLCNVKNNLLCILHGSVLSHLSLHIVRRCGVRTDSHRHLRI